jgi:hypothetical protein
LVRVSVFFVEIIQEDDRHHNIMLPFTFRHWNLPEARAVSCEFRGVLVLYLYLLPAVTNIWGVIHFVCAPPSSN